MFGSHAMEVPARPRGATLVSVDGRTYPLQSARVTAEATGGIARSTLTQTFLNPYAEALEVVYTLPLPADGAVIGYTMTLGERVIRGEVRRREEARAQFEKALLEGRSAALLEQERDDTFTQRLGSLPAGQTAEIAIEVLHPLAFLLASGEDGPQWEYRFPTVVGVRYQGAPGRVPDADRLDVDRADGAASIPTRIELALTMTDDAGQTVQRVEPMPLDRDLIVRWPAARAELGVRLVEGPGLPGDAGRYGLLTITPPRVPQFSFARDLTILLDASGSMGGPPIEWAKAVAAGLLKGLSEGDRFEVIAFSSRPSSLTGGIVGATDTTIRRALDALGALSAGGGTEMVEAMVEALRPLRAGSQHQVVLITDGQIGFEDAVVARVVGGLPDGARLHTVGVGAAPNRTLTARAARAGRGMESFVCGDDEVDGAVKRLVAATSRPVLTDVWIESHAVLGVAPARPRDVFQGQPLVVALELATEGGVVEVSGRLAGTPAPWRQRIEVPAIASRTEAGTTIAVGALFGRETIADLELNGVESDAYVERVALRHRIASRMTSLVAVADEPSVDPRQPRRKTVLPVEVPAFQSVEGLGLQSAMGIAGHGRRVRVAEARSRGVVFDALEPPRALGRIPDAFSRLIRGFRVSSPEASMEAHVIAVDGDVLIIEFESPEGGCEGPDEGTFEVMGRPEVSGVLMPERSCPAGRHEGGLLLRVAVRRTSGRWSVGDAVTCSWGDRETYRVVVSVPAAPGAGGLFA